MKKWIAMVQTLVLCLILLGGCAGKNPESSVSGEESPGQITEEEQWELVGEAYEFCFPLVMEPVSYTHLFTASGVPSIVLSGI